ncbi:MAG: hypothetical protein WCP25_08005 [Polynucleobacter sp.]
MSSLVQRVVSLVLLMLVLSACNSAKLEARLEANPQCKDVYNAKTGALMPCSGSDRSFYIAAGIEAPRQARASVVANTAASPVAAQTPTPQLTQASQPLQAQPDCKPSIHKKTGGILPCPPLD